MNRFISILSLGSFATLASLIALIPQAIAQTVNSGEVEMTATIGTFCIFENEIDGTLGVPSGQPDTLDSTALANGITALDGAAGSIDVTCNDPTSQIGIDTVTENNTAEITVNTFTTTVTGLANPLSSVDGAASNAVAVGSTNTETLLVNLAATYNSNLSAGDYTYTVNLVANP